MPSSCLDTCWVDDMAVWWFRATCFHGLKYLCVNREVLKTKSLWKQKWKHQTSVCIQPMYSWLVVAWDASESPSVTLLILRQWRTTVLSTWLMESVTLNLALWEILSQSWTRICSSAFTVLSSLTLATSTCTIMGMSFWRMVWKYTSVTSTVRNWNPHFTFGVRETETSKFLMI